MKTQIVRTLMAAAVMLLGAVEVYAGKPAETFHVAEPSSLALVLMGGAGLVWWLRKR